MTGIQSLRKDKLILLAFKAQVLLSRAKAQNCIQLFVKKQILV
jgi:hypothetical protein